MITRKILLSLVALLSTASAFAADITADLWQDFDFTTLDTTNLGTNDHVTGGTWGITNSGELSTSTSAEKISTGLISGNSDAGGTRGLRYDGPGTIAASSEGVVNYETAASHATISYGFWFKFPSEYTAFADGGQPDLLYVENVLGTNEVYVKLTSNGSQSSLILYTAEAGGSATIDVEPDTWYWITAVYGTTHRLRVFNDAGTEVGTEKTRTGSAQDITLASLGNLIGDEGGGGPFDFDDWVMDWADATFPLGPPLVEIIADVEQEGFRWGVDDNIEALHGFEAAQDTNITIADAQSRLLRVLVNAQTVDPASAAYTLRYRKNGTGLYAAVPVGASFKTTPVIEAADATESGNNTASASWAVSHPTASSGDLLIFCLAWDDSTATTDVTEPAGPNSEVLSEVNATPATDSGTETRSKCWYTVATGSWSASTVTFTPAATEQWTGVTVRVPAGEFDASTPIGGSGVNNTAGGADTNVLNAAFTAGASDGSGKLITWASADVDPQTVASGWAEVANEDRGAVSGGFFSRNTAVSNSESITAGAVSTIAGDSWASVSFVVRAPTANNEVYVDTSANIAAGGEVTTARLTAPAGKSSVTDFVTGRRWDDENGTDTTDITTDDYTELEWLVALSGTPAASDYFEFRSYSGAGELEFYTLTPRWTIPSAGGGVKINPMSGLSSGGTAANPFSTR